MGKFAIPVAGEALSMLCGSKIILQVGDIDKRSPLANVNVLLSSKTEFRFSIQILSTGPSRTSHICSPRRKKKCEEGEYEELYYHSMIKDI